VFGVALLVASPAFGQVGVSESYRRARQVLDAASQAVGPEFDTISYHVDGKLHARDQSPNADGAPVALDFHGGLLFDLKRDRLTWEAGAVFPGGFNFHGRTLAKDGSGTNLDLVGRTVTPLPNTAQLRETIGFRIPRYLVTQAVQRSTSLRWVGEADYQGRKQNVISFATGLGNLVTLFIDARTNLPTKYELLGTDPIAGDAVTEVVIMGYESVEGGQLSKGHIQTVAGQPAQEWRYSDIRLNQPLDDSVLAAPADFKPAVQLPQTPAVKELAKDVYQVEGLGGGFYRSLFVVFNDYVLVVEAVLNDATSRAVLDKIKETAPGKPVRYVVQTHHHSDHSGGLRTYIAEGITVVTAPGNVEFIKRFAAAPFTVQPDTLSKKARAPVIETIRGKKRVFTDGAHTVELYDIGPAPHTNEMVIAWLPKEKILFTGDLFGRYADDSLVPAPDGTQHLAKAIGRLGFSVETIIDVHTRPSTMADLQKALSLPASAAN
jgi:glyoxylase-like metal-dependent hydrolase (beta-lactamase superfamily II)